MAGNLIATTTLVILTVITFLLVLAIIGGPLAKTGLPLQVFKARQELLQHIALSGVAKKQVKHTRKWMTFSAAAHVAGTGEAKDVLEGVGAFLLAKKNYYDHLLGAWQARAALELAVGVPPGAPTK